MAIVNEAFQRAYFPGEEAVGQHVGYGEPFSEIVGLVKDSAFASVADEPTPVLYLLRTLKCPASPRKRDR